MGAIAAAAFTWGACTMKNQEAPSLTGPSELGTSITVTVSPDVLTQDGFSQSLVTITARGPNGEPLRNLSLRAQILVDGVAADFGSLSARTIVTDANGRATLVFTTPGSPAASGVDRNTVVTIAVTPVGSDFGNATPRTASIRLVPPGIVIPPDGLQPRFTPSTLTPTDNQQVFFDASASTAPANNPIVNFAWDFGDGSRGSGITTTHSFTAPGTFVVTLTVSDAFNRSVSTSQVVSVSGGALPTAAFNISPTSATAPRVGQVVNFNAAESNPGLGRTIRSYEWVFGDGSSATTSTAQTTHTYQSAGDFIATLKVIDDVGRVSVAFPLTLTIFP